MDTYLYEKLPFLKCMDEVRRTEILDYLRTAPQWVLESIMVQQVKGETVLLREGGQRNMVYILAEGIAEAVDMRIYGMPFTFKQFHGMYAFGGMEVVLNIDMYMTTIKTVTDSTFIAIPGKVFEKWMHLDAEAFQREAKRNIYKLLEESRTNRLYLFLQGADRLALMLIKLYEDERAGDVLQFAYDRQQMSDTSGLSIKTVSRSIKKFSEENLISREGNRISIDRTQYEALKKTLSEKVSL